MSLLFRRSCVCCLSPSVMMIPAPSNTEKKTHINGHASPSHLAANTSNNHAGKQSKSQCLLLFNWLLLSALFWLHCHCLFFSFSDMFILISDVEGYMKTDDRMRLAKERREERERSLGRWCPWVFFPTKFLLWYFPLYSFHNWLWERLASQ